MSQCLQARVKTGVHPRVCLTRCCNLTVLLWTHAMGRQGKEIRGSFPRGRRCSTPIKETPKGITPWGLGEHSDKETIARSY